MNKLTQTQIKSLFTYKDGELYWKIAKQKIHIGDKAGSLNKITGYYKIGINGKQYRTHRLIYLYHHGYLPKYIDHINCNKSDNNIENLREVTNSQNGMNSKSYKNSSSKYKGVCWNKRDKNWASYIKFNYKLINLGQFKLEIEAAKTYNKAAIELFGEYSNLNEVE